jgi:mRNA-degrading endonuclease RelE of RelBE toxin-antitoxin system
VAIPKFDVVIPPKCKRSLDRITSSRDLQEALDLVEALEEDPFPPYSRQLAEAHNLWCFDFGSGKHRAVYQVSTKQRRVIIKAIGPRSDVYQRHGLYRKSAGLKQRRKV